MDKKIPDQTPQPDGEPMVSAKEMQELKRDMRSAQWNDWFVQNQQKLMAGVVIVVLGLVAGGMWLEHNRSEHDAAANLFQQAQNETDIAKKKALLESVVSEFSSASYAAMAQVQLSVVDAEHADVHLQALMDHAAAMDEWKWQARLDLAALKIEQGDLDAARSLLSVTVGKQYQQQRYYLLAGLASDPAEKKKQLQKALDAASVDPDMKQRIAAELSLLAS